MAPSTTYSSAKDLFDRIGGTIQKQVHTAALEYNSQLLGHLSLAKFREGHKFVRTDAELCKLNYEFDTNVTNGKSNPCYGRQAVRFSDTNGAECYWNRIKGNDKNNEAAACAPFRRLHLCDRNLEEIEPEKIISTHNLLVDVLLAAKYEGESIRNEYDQKKDDYKLGLCTALARSFADIGDIIRGKDLYRRDSRTDKLEDNLKVIFGNIYKELTTTNGSNGKNREIEERYGKDPNFFQLREDWWEVNRQQVWNAITCYAHDSHYTKMLADGSITVSPRGQCRDVADVPTNFDYVPQYLRWFEEWAEDFCRKKKKQLPPLKTNCRGLSGKDKYCSGNGYDCERTIYKKGKLVIGYQCTNCSVLCRIYEKWIDNQKKEFLKQKKKCENEISGNGRQRQRPSTTSNYKGYEEHFYEIFETKYKDVDAFLELLNKENECKDINEEKEKIDFTENHGDKNSNNKGTFYHSEYCEVCPGCGMKKTENGNGWIQKKNGNCDSAKHYNIKVGAKSTNIDVLSFGDKLDEIKSKMEKFCKTQNGNSGQTSSSGSGDCGGKNSGSSLCEPWKCYESQYVEKVVQDDDEDYDDDYHSEVTGAGGLCVLRKDQKKKEESDSKSQNDPAEIQKTFNDFFYFWIRRFLNDSMYWRGQVGGCLKNGKKKCGNQQCKYDCDCFQKWVVQKEKEWTNIKKHFNTQDGFGNQGEFLGKFRYDVVLKFVLQKGELLTSIKEGYGNSQETEAIRKMMDEEEEKEKQVKAGASSGENNTTIDKLLQHEEEEAKNCLKTHKDEEKCDEDEEAAPPQVTNPCSGESGNKRYPALVNQIAHQMHDDALAEASKRGLSLLKADATKGKYKKNGNADELKDVCKITLEHSNDYRGTAGEPCTGKDNDGVRFKIGNGWTHVVQDKTSYKDVFLPPRREHMCTSNLENLDFNSVIKNDNVNDSFLGDVLLAANKQAERTKDYFTNKDDSVVCRSVRNSFADLGDIIRGRDMWDKEKGMGNVKGHLEAVFDNIRKSLTGKGVTKYESDTNHIKLREDWWEANRYQVWNAMKCAMKNGNIDKCNGIPLDDYIPQRLRWMTEWAEWFCKMQSQEYKTLQDACRKCKDKYDGKGCIQNDNDCEPCKQACDIYGKNIRTWREQWTKMDSMYQWIYLYAKNDANSRGRIAYIGDEKKEKHVYDFLREVYKQNKASASKRSKRSTSDKSDVYANAAGYVHQEAHIGDCKQQNVFCDKKNGDNSNSGKTNEKYAFREKPYDHDNACDCEKSMPKRVPTRPQDPWWESWRTRTTPWMLRKWKRRKIITTCDIVGEILKDKNGTKQVGQCHPKNNDKNYLQWNCDENKIKTTEVGACIPPRRQKLCVHYLEKIMTNTNELKNAFIKSAAAETFLLWQNYKKDKNGNAEDLDNTLKGGNIPDEFKRQMFYTFADYRDICLNTDISSITDIHSAVSIAKDNIYEVFKKNYQTSIDQRKSWWETNGPVIWEGMLCALSHAVSGIDKGSIKKNKYSDVTFSDDPNGTKLTKFAERPQFLRWFTEWGEDFCKQQKKQFEILQGKCVECTVSESGTSDATGNKTCDDKDKCDTCKTACTTYKEWIGTWKENYKKQKKRYSDVKETKPYNEDSNVKASDDARDYLNKQLKNMTCTNGLTNENCDYTCMNKASSTNTDMPESLDDEPKDVKGKCNCVPDECNALSVSGSGFPDAGVFGGGVLAGKCKGLGEPKKKIEPPQYDPTNDILKSTIPIGIALVLGSIAFLFIKKKVI
ncbi:hypothetical protein PFTANZ_06020 [Plasmodium falciparum Tanzania (2000708)]|uniref:Duffy-binding-like domain-containing protein n=2 Tax=Plasmodium falciparum TaxID=5833 RepID=A0A024VYB8_PLAFA|nr:hypothetical protein PFTANZ_06020 [Plasmodium falciparum Tanzania (2000708)]